MLAVAGIAQAQNIQPFIEPGYFEHDLQFFAPASDLDTYGGPILREGWFGSYDRMYLRMSRPDDVDSKNRVDRGWGNRVDVGYIMSGVNQDHGWLFSHSTFSTANWFETYQEKINRVNEDDEGRAAPDDDDPERVNPVSDRNDYGFPDQARFYKLRDSLNVGNFNSIELNKLFRMPPLHHGGILEPFIGFRYVKFQSTWQQQDYFRYNEDGLTFPFPPVIPNRDLFDIGDAETEDLITDRFYFTNDMIGGQLGMRWKYRVSRWNLSSELRAIGFHNFQNLERTFEIERTYYDGGGQGSDVEGQVRTKFRENAYTNSTVVAADIRMQAAYELTRDVSFQVGMQYLGFYNGIGRGRFVDYNSQDLHLVGVTFGVEVNR
ncbi:MAG: hypothetical protein EA424_14200 [Planctomycetaceae bacterium]|nr:MAG: hypothetical protein EA424_14200 [Planctomycetaceae bacterium]